MMTDFIATGMILEAAGSRLPPQRTFHVLTSIRANPGQGGDATSLSAKTICWQSFHRNIHTSAPKNSLAALVERFTAAVLHHFPKQASHCLYAVQHDIELGELSPAQLLPAVRGASGIAEPEKHLPGFVQAKPEPSRLLDDCKPIKHRCVVTSLPTRSWRRRKQSDALVVANCGGLKPNLPSDLRNG
jgi:hypothetical protein